MQQSRVKYRLLRVQRLWVPGAGPLVHEIGEHIGRVLRAIRKYIVVDAGKQQVHMSK